MKPAYLLAIVSVSMAACGPQFLKRNAEMYELAAKSWQGHKAPEMYDAWGRPSRIEDFSELEDTLGEAAVFLFWDYENRSVEEQAALSNPPARTQYTMPTTQTCMGRVDQFGNVLATCSENDNSWQQAMVNQSYQSGAAVGKALNPRRYCQVTAKVVGGIVEEVWVTNSGCYLTDEEFYTLAPPGTPLPPK